MARLFIYVVARDFGFAPNPFHGTCTLATCKPRIRSTAKPGDWLVGMGGGTLGATNRCIYAMEVSGSMSFNEYWNDVKFRAKRPVRNGSRTAMLGDNIYHREDDTIPWTQEDSHHSKSDGTPEWWNVEHDTSVDKVLYSNRFVYFGKSAPIVPKQILAELNYKNGRNHRTFVLAECRGFMDWIGVQVGGRWNIVLDDPFQFLNSDLRYSKETNSIG